MCPALMSGVQQMLNEWTHTYAHISTDFEREAECLLLLKGPKGEKSKALLSKRRALKSQGQEVLQEINKEQ